MYHPRGHYLRTALIFFALLALTVRGMMPVGFMPGAERFSLVICTATGAQTIDVDAGFNPGKVPHNGDEGNHCPFAPLLSSALTTVPPFIAAPLEAGLRVDILKPVLLARTAQPHSWNSRAPPAAHA
jgi:hypothetical protein